VISWQWPASGYGWDIGESCAAGDDDVFNAVLLLGGATKCPSFLIARSRLRAQLARFYVGAWFYSLSLGTPLRPMLLFANTDVSTTKMCLDTSILAKSIMGRREYFFCSLVSYYYTPDRLMTLLIQSWALSSLPFKNIFLFV
jgi:hypothetical protein